MPWPLTSLRERRVQVRDDIAAHLPGADATVPNSVLRAVSEAQASLTHDNDLHLDWLARQMMPDTAEAEFADRWAAVWLPDGRKPATFASGPVTVSGLAGSTVPTGAELTATVLDATGTRTALLFTVRTGVTLAVSTATVTVDCADAGALGNLATSAQLAFVAVPDGIDGQAAVAAPGLAGSADVETDADLRARYIARIQEPPHGGTRGDWVQWALEVAGVTRAWAASEAVGTMTVRIMLDTVRAGAAGIPEAGDLALVAAHIDTVRPVTVAQTYILAPTAVALNITVTDLANDTPEVRTAIAAELADMLRARAAPGQKIYGSWISEAISAATGEDHHSGGFADVTPASAGHIVVPGTVTYA